MSRTFQKGNGKLTQQIVADELGISRSIISSVINDPETNRASAETKKRIFELFRNAPDSGRQAKIGDTVLLVNDPASAKYFFQSALLCGVQSRVVELGLKLQIVTPNQELRSYLFGAQLRGMLLMSAENVTEQVRELAGVTPVVTVNPEEHGDYLGNAVIPDYDAGMMQALGHLLAKGHRRIGFVGHRPPPAPCLQSRVRERLREFREACDAYGLAVSEEDIHLLERDNDEERLDCEPVLARWLEQAVRPSAFVLYNDHLAIKFYHAALVAGIRIPEQISLVSFDNEPVCEQLTPPLTSVSPEFYEVGRMAVDLLIARSEPTSPQKPGFKTICPVKLIERASVALSEHQ